MCLVLIEQGGLFADLVAKQLLETQPATEPSPETV